MRVVLPRSARASDILFECPACHRQLRKGLGYVKCPGCGQGNVAWNVHKARPVFTPRDLVMINPPRPESAARLNSAGGGRRALEWVLDGLTSQSPESTVRPPGRKEFTEGLRANGIDPALAEKLADQAEEAGALRDASDDLARLLVPQVLEEAERQAFDVAMALGASRLPSADLATTTSSSALKSLYQVAYPRAMRRAGLAGIDLVDKFPVLGVTYGYTRGGAEPHDVTLRPFRGRNTAYRFYGKLAETEALFVRLHPQAVLRWLRRSGQDIHVESGAGDRVVRLALIEQAVIPALGQLERREASAGHALVRLVHSYAHRMIRQTSVLAGIDRDALSEYLVPQHLGFFLFAAPRGDFVLGGLQAVMEQDLHMLLGAVVGAESRCPLDPGCVAGGGACAACLHLGEPSCRRYNTDLDRRALFGRSGYFSSVETETAG